MLFRAELAGKRLNTRRRAADVRKRPGWWRCARAPTGRLASDPLKSWERRSVNHPRRKVNLENCWSSCRPVSLSLRDQTEGGSQMKVSLSLHSGLRADYCSLSQRLLPLCCLSKREDEQSISELPLRFRHSVCGCSSKGTRAERRLASCAWDAPAGRCCHQLPSIRRSPPLAASSSLLLPHNHLN